MRKARPAAARPTAARPAAEPEPGAPRRRGRPKGSKNGVRTRPVKEPKPVKWW